MEILEVKQKIQHQNLLDGKKERKINKLEDRTRQISHTGKKKQPRLIKL